MPYMNNFLFVPFFFYLGYTCIQQEMLYLFSCVIYLLSRILWSLFHLFLCWNLLCNIWIKSGFDMVLQPFSHVFKYSFYVLSSDCLYEYRFFMWFIKSHTAAILPFCNSYCSVLKGALRVSFGRHFSIILFSNEIIMSL